LAKFNPDVPLTQDPEWLKQSHPIDRPRPDTSMGQLFEGIGNIGEMIIQGTDTLIKKNIQDVATEKASQIRDSFTAQLDSLAATADGTGSNPTQARPSLLADPTSEAGAPTDLLPTGVKNLTSKVTTLVGARNNGHISETEYYGQLSNLAKSLRSWYPGYRDYIDQQISKVVGVDPANAYIRSRIADLNAMGKEDADKKHLLNRLSSEDFMGHPEAAIIYSDLRNNRISTDEAMGKMNRIASQRYNYKVQDAEWQGIQRVEAMHKLKATKQLYQMGSDIATNAFSIPSLPGLRTPEGVLELTKQIAAGKAQLSPPEWEVIKTYTHNRHRLAENEMRKRAQENGMMRLLGPELVNKTIKESLYPFESLMDAINNKDAGGATLTVRMTEAFKAAAENHVFTDEHMRESAIRLYGFRKIVGDQAFGGLADRHFMEKGGNKIVDGFMQSKISNIFTPFDVLKQPSVKEDLKEVEASPTPELKQPGVGAKFIKLIEEVGRKGPDALPDQEKIKLIKYGFGPNNAGVTSIVGPEKHTEVSPGNYRRIPGDVTYLRRVTSPAIVDEIWRLSQTDKNLWKDYEGWVKDTIRNDIYRRQLMDLQSLTLRPEQRLAFNGQQFMVLDENGTDVLQNKTVASYNKLNPFVRNTLNDVNSMLTNLIPIAEKTSQDAGTTVGAYLLQSMRQFGYEFTPGNKNAVKGKRLSRETVDNIPSMMGNALVTFYTAVSKNAMTDAANNDPALTDFSSARQDVDAKKDLTDFLFNRVPVNNFAPEDRRNTPLNEWLKNPSGNQPFKTNNLSDNEILGMDRQSILPGESPEDAIKRLRNAPVQPYRNR
jgi:hypothetical protein